MTAGDVHSRHQRGVAIALMLAAMFASVTAFAQCLSDPTDRNNDLAAIASSGGMAERHGGNLTLATRAGPLDFADGDCNGPSSDTCRRYRLASILAGQHFYVVALGFYEGGIYLLVDRASGAVTELKGYPWVSPDGKRFVTVTGDDPYEWNGIEVWLLAKSQPVLERRFTFGLAGGETRTHCLAGWTSASRIAVHGTRWRGQMVGERDEALGEFDAVVARSGGAWRLERR